jgi:hypothetical protein
MRPRTAAPGPPSGALMPPSGRTPSHAATAPRAANRPVKRDTERANGLERGMSWRRVITRRHRSGNSCARKPRHQRVTLMSNDVAPLLHGSHAATRCVRQCSSTGSETECRVGYDPRPRRSRTHEKNFDTTRSRHHGFNLLRWRLVVLERRHHPAARRGGRRRHRRRPALAHTGAGLGPLRGGQHRRQSPARPAPRRDPRPELGLRADGPTDRSGEIHRRRVRGSV